MGLCLGREVEKETKVQDSKLESGAVPEYFPLGVDMTETSKNYRMRPMDTPESHTHTSTSTSVDRNESKHVAHYFSRLLL